LPRHLGTPRPGLVEAPYDVRLSSDADGIDLGIGILRVHHRWSDLASAGTVIVPALAAWDAPVPSGLVEALKAAHR
jgi:hypothetical protein